eukprot:TRINITY_DN7162_c0_g1_i1.p1 TRINITY_DN7162_c0_g1~~TRINITY_DN7162_c0_g1_i1.p1  ORF type:complete len:213 (+),score=51.41 TRINITY_DN7162_c0_g1_i1:31-639(+)
MAQTLDISAILPHQIFLGSRPKQEHVDQIIQETNIQRVLNVSLQDGPVWPTSIEYKCVKIADKVGAPLREIIDEGIEFIDQGLKRNESVLVHCEEGRSRSVSVVMAYLIQKQGKTCLQSFDLIKQGRSSASPNYGFCKELMEFEQENNPAHLVEQNYFLSQVLKETVGSKFDVEEIHSTLLKNNFIVPLTIAQIVHRQMQSV